MQSHLELEIQQVPLVCCSSCHWSWCAVLPIFFNTEALPEGTIMIFPIAIRNHPSDKKWKPFNGKTEEEIYLGGLESIGFGHCVVNLKGVE